MAVSSPVQESGGAGHSGAHTVMDHHHKRLKRMQHKPKVIKHIIIKIYNYYENERILASLSLPGRGVEDEPSQASG
jgi:hypothetical protein